MRNTAPAPECDQPGARLSGRRLWAVLLIGAVAALAGLFLPSCGGKGPVPRVPVPTRPAPASPPAPSARVPTPAPDVTPPPIVEATAAGRPLRVLVRENFEQCRIEGARQGYPLTVERVGGELRLSRAAQGPSPERPGRRHWIAAGSSFRLEAGDGGVLSLDGQAWRGSLYLFLNAQGIACAVNLVGLEEYLRSVVPTELSPKQFPLLEALKAQAVAARTFAVAEAQRRREEPFDLYPDLRSQVYRGVAAEDPLSDRAVAATAGWIATFQGRPVTALYSSTCGGKTESYENIFHGPAIPYLRGGVECPDEASPYHVWDEWIEIPRIQGELDRWAHVGRLRGLAPGKHSPSGRLIEMTFSGDQGKRVLHGNDLRFALGMRSNFVDELAPVVDDDGFIRRVHVRGRGWGHGVGLCQYGSVALARDGFTFEQILKHYYTGIDLSLDQ